MQGNYLEAVFMDGNNELAKQFFANLMKRRGVPLGTGGADADWQKIDCQGGASML